MKYVITWRERPGGSATDAENAQQRVLHLFSKWEQPEDVTIHQFLVRVGEFGGYMVVETDHPATIHRIASIYAVFQFKIEPVLDVMDAVGVEQDAIAWREAVG